MSRLPIHFPVHNPSLARGRSLIVVCICLLWQPVAVLAANPAAVIRRIGRVADDVPLRNVDDVAQGLGHSRAGRDLLRRAGSPVDDADTYRRALNRAVRETLQETGDPALLRHLDQLDDVAKEALVVLGRGSRTIREGIPDVALRSRFLGDGGAETVAALGRYGDLISDSIRFDAALRAGRIVPPPGARQVTLEDFGRFFRSQGDRGHHFWTTYVRPHWGKWLAGGALAAVLLAPEDYLDQAGDLTRAGARKVIKFAGDELGAVLTGIIEGVGESGRETARQTFWAFVRAFFSDIWGIVTLAGLLLGLGITGFCLRNRIRAWLVRLGVLKATRPQTS